MSSARHRVVLFGPPLAGKRTLMAAASGISGSPLRSFDTYSDDVHHILQIGSIVAIVRGADVFELVTFSGSLWDQAAWEPILAAASAVALVLDAQVSRSDENRKYIAMLAATTPPPRTGCVIVTKQDLAATVRLVKTADLVAGTPFATWPLEATRADKPSGIWRVLERLFSQRPHWG